MSNIDDWLEEAYEDQHGFPDNDMPWDEPAEIEFDADDGHFPESYEDE